MAEPVSTTALALKAAPYVFGGMMALGNIGSSIYGGKRARMQEEENERATARAAMISALTRSQAIPQPKIVQSSGYNAFNTLDDLGSIGMSALPYLK